MLSLLPGLGSCFLEVAGPQAVWPGEHLSGVSGWVCPGVFTQQRFGKQERLQMAAEQL